jgi:transposase
MTRHINTYNPSVPAVMRLIQSGNITIKDAAEILGCSTTTVKNKMKEFGIRVLVVGAYNNRKDSAEVNKVRKILIEKLAKQIKYEGKNLHELSKEHFIPVRTLYRWLHLV